MIGFTWGGRLHGEDGDEGGCVDDGGDDGGSGSGGDEKMEKVEWELVEEMNVENIIARVWGVTKVVMKIKPVVEMMADVVVVVKPCVASLLHIGRKFST